MPGRYIIIMFLLITTAFGNEMSSTVSTQAQIEAEINRKEFEFMEGEWFAYVMKNNRKNLFAAYSFVLNRQGEWNTRDFATGQTTPTGRFSILNGKLVFVRKAKDESQIGLEAELSGKNFIIKSSLQDNVCLRFEKIPENQLMKPSDIIGKWTFFQVVDEVERKSPFTVEFTTDGKYSVIDGNRNTNEALSGRYEIKSGCLYLVNQAPKTNILWHKSSFFLDGEKLVLNNLDVYCFALKD